MQVFLYEFITGGGLFCLPESPSPSGSLLREGLAMLQCLAQDFSDLGCQVVVLQDQRIDLSPYLPEGVIIVPVGSADDERQRFRQTCEQTDATLVVAPEFDRLLIQRTEWASRWSNHLLSPSVGFVTTGSCKWDCHRLWQRANVPTIETYRVANQSSWQHLLAKPVVTKPVDGAGSVDVFLWKNASELPSNIRANEKILIQPLIYGTPVSVCAIGNSQGFCQLPAATQQLDNDLKYLGGKLPIPESMRQRAYRLARQAITTMGPFRGWIGVDMILGSSFQGGEDVVVELNPRITSSYVGLRRLLENNLSELILHPPKDISTQFSNRIDSLEFTIE